MIFQRSPLAYVDSEQQLAAEVRLTVAHEVAHHCGIDDEQRQELGWTDLPARGRMEIGAEVG